MSSMDPSVSNTLRPYLLCLQAPAPDTTAEDFQARFLDHLCNVLQACRPPTGSEAIHRLDVVFVLGDAWTNLLLTRSRTEVFEPLQHLLNNAYTAICLAAARTKADLDFPGGIDAKVLILHNDCTTDEHAGTVFDTRAQLTGPLVLAQTFAQFLQQEGTKLYKICYHDGSLPKYSLLEIPQRLLDRLSTTPAQCQSAQLASTPGFEAHSSVSHYSVAVGGTFDHLHIGHKLLLTFTLLLAQPPTISSGSSGSSHPTSINRHITIGITGDALLTKKAHSSVLESWSTRCLRTHSFLESLLLFPYPPASSSDLSTQLHPDPLPVGVVHKQTIDGLSVTDAGQTARSIEHTYVYTSPKSSSDTASENGNSTSTITLNYVRLDDPFGPTITNPDISALVISAETRAGGKAINEKRREKEWRELEIFEVGVLDSGVKGEKEGRGEFEGKVSSTEIRRRMVER